MLLVLSMLSSFKHKLLFEYVKRLYLFC
jgi:hypothetical protein